MGSLATAAYRSGISECPDAICPVPLHTKRLIWRGFNQSTELAKQISRSTNIPVLNTALVRTRNTKPQTQLGHKERKENLKNAFAANPEQIRGKSILLIDDVYTTGATLRECSKAILGAGAAKVDVLVLARTQEEPI